MNILILGAGAREHALAWAVLQNPKCDRLVVAPGNAGIARIAELADLPIEDADAVAGFAAETAMDLVIIGPEAPLAAGVADALRAAGIAVVGPGAAAARLESSKAFTKSICDACGAPTAAYAHFTDAAAAADYVRQRGAPLVIKADGLAAGKGVTMAETEAQALEAVEAVFAGAFGSPELVIEEWLMGEEASLFVLCDGETAVPIGTAQDHKRAFDGDKGPNTGGMGAYSPAPVMTDDVTARAMDEIVHPTLAEMARRGTPFQGILYAGLMIEKGAPKLIEYNTRLGDPEAQVLMMRLGGQVLDLMQACAMGGLADIRPVFAEDHALTVVLAAKGYPEAYEKGSVIGGLEAPPETSSQIVFHAGTARTGGAVTAAGGRVLSATARGASLREARDRAYALAEAIDWPEGFYRRDIGWRAL
ncbi:phosphoribosylamine--glycine ligase [Pseudoroseicyclus aestuarii]|uniref:Phosphoribosylamine--glycine ligase n=1 Tax=Pseudoroseicyclus aestuarii TaxID=1795041 RepID=A0A318SVF5_9RHOB|nr:phosphoribosylamine--glycine ligase [Pseudoroseicyclus aestuarii]PYE85830.1 phosphoribosylamine--glycine ligase [Pseudoroseicyclus aestuarii]